MGGGAGGGGGGSKGQGNAMHFSHVRAVKRQVAHKPVASCPHQAWLSPFCPPPLCLPTPRVTMVYDGPMTNDNNASGLLLIQ
jgi:hypothetical protein